MTKIFYHTADLDGKCSGAIIKKVHPEAELIGIDHGDEFPWGDIIPGETVYMADWSFSPFDEMCGLARICELVWIDHHESAMLQYRRLLSERRIGPLLGLRDKRMAACELAWLYCFQTLPIPAAVWLLGRYDVWDHSDPDILPFQLGMRMFEAADPQHPGSDEFWGRLLFGGTVGYDSIISEICEDGNKILDYQYAQDREAVQALQTPVWFEGLHCLAFNQRRTNSKPFREAAQGYDAILSYWKSHTGKWIVSLYDTDKTAVDLGELARSYGGGGHAGAAGFQVQELPWEEAWNHQR